LVPGGARASEIVLAGAHYDTVPGSPGADDNASGVAALIEIARALHEAVRAFRSASDFRAESIPPRDRHARTARRCAHGARGRGTGRRAADARGQRYGVVMHAARWGASAS
jgi:hypothetical protein